LGGIQSVFHAQKDFRPFGIQELIQDHELIQGKHEADDAVYYLKILIKEIKNNIDLQSKKINIVLTHG
jgi:hypothetical protein